MKRHLTASPRKVGTPSEDRPRRGAASRRPTAFNDAAPAKPAPGNQPSALASVPVRTHTLILTGELNHRSAHELEAEIDRLCGEGVTSITLDLRELTYIDSVGVAVIAFRCELCERRGYEISLIPGSPAVRRAFDQADVTEFLPFQSEDLPTSPSL